MLPYTQRRFLREGLNLRQILDGRSFRSMKWTMWIGVFGNTAKEFGLMHFPNVATAYCISHFGMDKKLVQFDYTELSAESLQAFEDEIFDKHDYDSEAY